MVLLMLLIVAAVTFFLGGSLVMFDIKLGGDGEANWIAAVFMYITCLMALIASATVGLPMLLSGG